MTTTRPQAPGRSRLAGQAPPHPAALHPTSASWLILVEISVLRRERALTWTARDDDAGGSGPDEGEEVGVELVLVRGDLGQAVGGAGIFLQGGIGDQLH